MVSGGAAQARAQAGISGTSTTGMRVLIIDDHASFADLLSCALGSVDGIVCVGTAASAQEGLRRAAELAPSVVVMDIVMPGVDGLAATRQLRATSPDTAVVVVSAHREPEWIAEAARAGASAYLPKGGSLTEMIETLLAARPGRMVLAPSLRELASTAELCSAAYPELQPAALRS